MGACGCVIEASWPESRLVRRVCGRDHSDVLALVTRAAGGEWMGGSISMEPVRAFLEDAPVVRQMGLFD